MKEILSFKKLKTLGIYFILSSIALANNPINDQSELSAMDKYLDPFKPILSAGIKWFGAGLILVGALKFLEAFLQKNPSEYNDSWRIIIVGAMIFLLAVGLPAIFALAKQ